MGSDEDRINGMVRSSNGFVNIRESIDNMVRIETEKSLLAIDEHINEIEGDIEDLATIQEDRALNALERSIHIGEHGGDLNE